MLKVKIFENPEEEDINEFLKTTNGQLVDIKYTESVEALGKLGCYQAILHNNVMIIYEVAGPGGMKLNSK